MERIRLFFAALIVAACSTTIPINERFMVSDCVPGRDVVLNREGYICDCEGMYGTRFRVFLDSIPDNTEMVSLYRVEE